MFIVPVACYCQLSVSCHNMLGEEQLDFYRENGFIVLDNVYSEAEIEDCSTEYDSLFESKRNSDLEATWKGNWNTKSDGVEPTSVTNISIMLTLVDIQELTYCCRYCPSIAFKTMQPYLQRCC